MALADDLALYAWGYWSHEHHPMRLDHLCLNTIQRKSPCDACATACPEGIRVDARTVQWTGCTNCNLCVTACPTSAINQSSTSFADVKRRVLELDDAVSFGCARASEKPDVPCSCLSAIPWELCAAAALSGGLALLAHPCSSCPHENLVAGVKALVHKLKEFLTEEGFTALVSMSKKTATADGANKRLAFQSLANTARSGASMLIEGTEEPTLSCYRALLLEVLESRIQAGEPAQVTWPTLTVDDTCRGCNVCALMCPHDAIDVRVPEATSHKEHFTEEELASAHIDPDAQVFIHQASKCTQCGLCYLSCIEQSLFGWENVHSSDLPVFKAMPLDVAVCEKCHRPFKPQADELRCTACSRFI